MTALSFPEELHDFVNAVKWTCAKTMPKWPHEYIVRRQVDENLFVKLVRHIRANGYQASFYRKKFTYYEEDGLVYWTMGATLSETTIVNRCRKEDSYQYRLVNGTLPE